MVLSKKTDNLLFIDVHERSIRLSKERLEHIESDHPEMSTQVDKIQETLIKPDVIFRSRTDDEVELYYRSYSKTPVTSKHLCVLVKNLSEDLFVITAYFTDTIKKGIILWQKK